MAMDDVRRWRDARHAKRAGKRAVGKKNRVSAPVVDTGCRQQCVSRAPGWLRRHPHHSCSNGPHATSRRRSLGVACNYNAVPARSRRRGFSRRAPDAPARCGAGGRTRIDDDAISDTGALPGNDYP